MKLVNFLILFLMTSCATLPELYKAVEKVADEDMITVVVSKEAKQTDLNLELNLKKTKQEN